MVDELDEQLQKNESGFPQEQEERDIPTRTKVTFPKPRKKGSKKKLILPIVLLAILAAGRFLLFREKDEEDSLPEPTPTVFEERITPTSTPLPEVNREDIRIEVFNGTGISKEAAFLEEELNELGYSEIETGNAKDQDYETCEVIFSDEVESAVRNEIEERLEDLYKEVESKSMELTGAEVQIFTGLRPGQSFPPTDTPTPKVTVSPAPTTPTPTSTASASPTVTSTP